MLKTRPIRAYEDDWYYAPALPVGSVFPVSEKRSKKKQRQIGFVFRKPTDAAKEKD